METPAAQDLLLDSLDQAIEEYRQLRTQLTGGAASAPLQEALAPPVSEPEVTV
ncbi:MAG TPA: hypothetical protein VJ885_14915 [Thermoanaerobaculia bacterium]|nr:hypothetical protein [Thermoanaerobaculia bacterium]